MSEYVKELQEALGRERTRVVELEAENKLLREKINLLEERDKLRGDLIATLRKRLESANRCIDESAKLTAEIKTLMRQKGIT